jgi:hypothetical protein
MLWFCRHLLFWDVVVLAHVHGISFRAWSTLSTFSGACHNIASPIERVVSQEWRTEEYFPPYALDDNFAPAFVAINSITSSKAVVSVYYGKTMEISWTNRKDTVQALADVTSVSLVAPSSTTHGYNCNQRLVWLAILNKSADPSTRQGTLTVQLPSSTAVAPPQVTEFN